MATPKIDQAKCTKCGTCIEVCPVEVFVKEGDKVIEKFPEKCINCKACEVQCPVQAIKVLD